MNETCLSRNDGCAVRENGQGIVGAGRRERDGRSVRYFTQERIGQYFEGGESSTLMARDYKSASDLVVEPKQRKYIVRRLTPLECCRLQGFPDWWTDGVEGSDSAQYKMWGNGIARPCAFDVLNRIARFVEKEGDHDPRSSN